jgi:hypothetical protein
MVIKRIPIITRTKNTLNSSLIHNKAFINEGIFTRVDDFIIKLL